MMKIDYKKAHIVIVIVGIIFVSLGAFHSNIWFDEAYSVALSRHDFADIWKIGGHDVHPILYYWLLRIVSLISEKIIILRLFSVIPIVILGILGYTHIRKDFGEKTGLIFSALTYFLPIMSVYAQEIRMYSWAVLSVTILAIYAFRISKEDSIKNWIIFFLASIFSIYIHYYGLMAAGLINLFLLFYLVKHKRKKSVIIILVLGIIQLISYIPWIMYLMMQLKNVSGGFWIKFTFPETLIELGSFQFWGNLNKKVAFIASIVVYGYLIYIIIKEKKREKNADFKPAILAILIYLSVVIAAVIMTAILKTSIIYYRYLFVITGLYIFAISFILSKEKNNKILICAGIILLIMSLMNEYKLINKNYGENNLKQVEYLNENIKQDDVFLFVTDYSGFITTTYFTEHKSYFYNIEKWNVAEAYKAFAPQMETVDDLEFLKDFDGRIWLIEGNNSKLYNIIKEEYNVEFISSKRIETEYNNEIYTMTLIEK